MSYTLTIDQGNTRTKATVFDNTGEVVCRGMHDTFDIETLIDNYGKYDLTGIIYSSVAGMDIRLIESIRRTYPEIMEVLSHQCDTGVKVAYNSPTTLGADRVAAAAGAIALYPSESLLVVDAGTAITIDIVDAEGCFRGGEISAGVTLRLKALHEATASLPEVDTGGEIPDFGHDTVTAMRSGAVMGVVREIEGALADANRIYGCRRVVLTGGDAALLAQHTSVHAEQIAIVPDLVAIGLNAILHRLQTARKHNT